MLGINCRRIAMFDLMNVEFLSTHTIDKAEGKFADIDKFFNQLSTEELEKYLSEYIEYVDYCSLFRVRDTSQLLQRGLMNNTLSSCSKWPFFVYYYFVDDQIVLHYGQIKDFADSVIRYWSYILDSKKNSTLPVFDLDTVLIVRHYCNNYTNYDYLISFFDNIIKVAFSRQQTSIVPFIRELISDVCENRMSDSLSFCINSEKACLGMVDALTPSKSKWEQIEELLKDHFITDDDKSLETVFKEGGVLKCFHNANFLSSVIYL
jgi:hypothetical protein